MFRVLPLRPSSHFWLVVSLLIAPWPIVPPNCHNSTSIYTQFHSQVMDGKKGMARRCSNPSERKVVITMKWSNFFSLPLSTPHSAKTVKTNNFAPHQAAAAQRWTRNMWNIFALFSSCSLAFFLPSNIEDGSHWVAGLCAERLFTIMMWCNPHAF